MVIKMRIVFLDRLGILPPRYSKELTIVKELPFTGVKNADVLLTSTAFCEKFGWSSGKNQENLGRMLCFRNGEEEIYFGVLASMFVSNAIWSREPPLARGVAIRIPLLKEVLVRLREDGKIVLNTVVIDFGSFMPYLSFDDKEEAMAKLERGIRELERI